MDTPEVFYSGGPAPAWLDKNAWAIPVQVSQEHVEKMPKIAMHKVELKVHMCCIKCAEIVIEEIRYLGGVFDVKVDQKNSKVTVTGRPDPDKVLRRAKKVDKHATFWPPSPPPPVVDVVVVEEKKEEKEAVVVEEKKGEKKEEKKEEKTEERKEEDKKEEKKEKEEKEEKKEEKTEEKKEEKKEKKKEEGEKKETPPPAELVQSQYPPYQSMYEGYPGYGYRPSQSYQPLYPEYNNMGYFGPQVPYMNPNYLKHVKIAY